jgi:preprotein translocase subunit SecE
MTVQETAGGAKKFLREVKLELKKVTWPTRQQLAIYSAVVLFAVIVVAVLIWAFDSLFAIAFRAFLRG